MSTIRKIFTYDNEEDRDIHEWLESLPQRQQSKYIRMAIRTYLQYLENSNGNIALPERKSSHVKPDFMKEKKSNVDNNKKNDNDFIDLDQSFIDDLGK